MFLKSKLLSDAKESLYCFNCNFYTELLERSDMSDIKLTIKQRKLRWLGYTLRKVQDDFTNQSLKWNPQGNRKVGRPKST